ncbi:MAG: M3 family oligoendopeptidase [Bacteroidia bacterium]|nr:M3 family oligoendopeptidase [Bacteroidia bacterium]
MESTIELPVRPQRRFIPETFQITDWVSAKPYYDELLSREISDLDTLRKWLRDWSEINSAVEEDASWRYIRMTCNTRDQALVDHYNLFISEIQPAMEPVQDKLNRKFIACPFSGELNPLHFEVYVRTVRNQVALFREANVELSAEISRESQKYGQIAAEMTITEDGKEFTLQQAANFLRDPDRAKREKIYMAIQARRGRDKNVLDDLLNRLIGLRHRIALNAGYKNFRDFRHQQLGRFDYTVADCFSFHEAVASEVVKATAFFEKEKQRQMKVDVLRPWDTEFDPDGQQPLKPSSDSKQLIERSVRCFRKVDPWFATRLEVMEAMGNFDLDSRIGKAPGGYNSTLSEIGVPFIFMNSANSQRDLVTMVHEGGHAMHSFLSRSLELLEFKNIPSEIAELASMSMELITMEHWEEFYPDRADLRRARKEQMEKVLKGLAWIARVDKFQHWLYEHPEHTAEQRTEYWLKLGTEFGTGVVNWSGMEEIAGRSWQMQLHIFEVPFYYIEYGIAQLGAIAMWRNYKKDPELAVKNYKAALSLGYTRPLPELFKTAGVRFDFSREYVRELTGFVLDEYKKLSE